MPLIERLTPGGNLYAHGSSTFAALVTLYRRMAEVRDGIDASIRAAATAYADGRMHEANSYTQIETSAARARITTVEGEVVDLDGRVGAVETLGGLAPGDVSDATVASLLSNAGSTTRTEMTRLHPLRGDLEISAAQFGAKGDGVADDTAALNAFLDYITANKRAGFMPGLNYRITGTLVIPSRAGWSLRGNGNRGTLITQDTANTPIIQLGNADSYALNHFSIKGLWFTYKDMQPATNTNANCIYFYDMPWQFSLDDLGFKRGSYAMRVRSGVGCPWGGNWGTGDGLHFGNELTVGGINFRPGINRVPNNTFGRFYVELGPMIGPVFDIRGYNFKIGPVEFIEATTDCPKLFVFGYASRVEFDSFKVENSPLLTGKQLVDLEGDCYVSIGDVVWTGGPRTTATFTTGTAYMFSLGATAAADAVLQIGSVDLHLGADSTSGLYLYRAGNDDTSVRVTRMRLGNGWRATNLPSNAVAANNLTVAEWVNGKIAARGDANVTLAVRNPNINRFTTAFTAPRTITLPSDGYNLHNGLYYDLIFDGAINGANTATIRAGSTTYRTQTTDKVALRFTWAGTSGANGWVLASVQPLV